MHIVEIVYLDMNLSTSDDKNIQLIKNGNWEFEYFLKNN